MIEYQLKTCRFTIDDEAQRVETIFGDGVTVAGTPNFDEESVSRARALGYEGSDDEVVWLMTRHHDLLHHVVAEAEGFPCSVTLHAVGYGYSLPPGMMEREERLVFLMQRMLNVGLDEILAPGAAGAPPPPPAA